MLLGIFAGLVAAGVPMHVLAETADFPYVISSSGSTSPATGYVAAPSVTRRIPMAQPASSYVPPPVIPSPSVPEVLFTDQGANAILANTIKPDAGAPAVPATPGAVVPPVTKEQVLQDVEESSPEANGVYVPPPVISPPSIPPALLSKASPQDVNVTASSKKDKDSAIVPKSVPLGLPAIAKNSAVDAVAVPAPVAPAVPVASSAKIGDPGAKPAVSRADSVPPPLPALSVSELAAAKVSGQSSGALPRSVISRDPDAPSAIPKSPAAVTIEPLAPVAAPTVSDKSVPVKTATEIKSGVKPALPDVPVLKPETVAIVESAKVAPIARNAAPVKEPKPVNTPTSTVSAEGLSSADALFEAASTKGHAPSVEKVEKKDDAKKAPAVADAASIPVPVSAVAPPKDMGPPVAEPTPAWQAQFIKKLVGGDGTLTLEPYSGEFENNMSDVVNVDQAVSLALENNPELKAAIEGVRSKYWDKVGAYSQFMPTVELNLARGRERSKPASYNDSNGDRMQNDLHLRQDRNLTIRQPLIDLGYLADIVSGHDKETAADFERKDIRDTLTSNTVNAYMRLIQSRMAIQLAQQYRGYLDDLAKKMQARVAGGGASSADLDRIISRSSLAQSAQVEAVSEYEASLSEFQRLTGAVPLKIRVPDKMAPGIPDSVDDALASAYKFNPLYQASLKKIDIAADDRNKSYTGMLPKVYAQYTGAYSYNAGGAAHGNPVDGVYPTQRTDSMMLIAQWALNAGPSVTGGLSASAKKRQMSMQSLDSRQRIDQGIRTSYAAVRATKQRLTVLQQTVEANERVVKGFEEQYKNGTRPLFDLLDAYEQLYNSRLNLMRVIFAYTQASYQVRLQMGDIVPSVLDVSGK